MHPFFSTMLRFSMLCRKEVRFNKKWKNPSNFLNPDKTANAKISVTLFFHFWTFLTFRTLSIWPLRDTFIKKKVNIHEQWMQRTQAWYSQADEWSNYRKLRSLFQEIILLQPWMSYKYRCIHAWTRVHVTSSVSALHKHLIFTSK